MKWHCPWSIYSYEMALSYPSRPRYRMIGVIMSKTMWLNLFSHHQEVVWFRLWAPACPVAGIVLLDCFFVCTPSMRQSHLLQSVRSFHSAPNIVWRGRRGKGLFLEESPTSPVLQWHSVVIFGCACFWKSEVNFFYRIARHASTIWPEFMNICWILPCWGCKLPTGNVSRTSKKSRFSAPHKQGRRARQDRNHPCALIRWFSVCYVPGGGTKDPVGVPPSWRVSHCPFHILENCALGNILVWHTWKIPVRKLCGERNQVWVCWSFCGHEIFSVCRIVLSPCRSWKSNIKGAFLRLKGKFFRIIDKLFECVFGCVYNYFHFYNEIRLW